MDLTKLPPKDRADFEKRLARLGIEADTFDDQTLELEAGTNMRLEMAGDSPISPMILQTKDLDTLRRWIGSPQKAVGSRTTQPFEAIIRGTNFATDVLPTPSRVKKRRSKTAKSTVARLSGTLTELTKIEPAALLASVKRAKAEPADFKLKSAELDTLRAAARNFIHGDPKLVEGFRPAIEAYFGEFQIAIWLKTRIIIKKNATLTLGTGVHNMTAYELIIESGGRIRSYGHLTVSVTKILRPGRVRPRFPLPDHVLSLSTLSRDPVFP